MLRAMILIILAIILLVVLVTQVILPMVTDKLEFFWAFRRNIRNDIIDLETPAKEELSARAHSATQEYKGVKKEIRDRIKQLDKLDRDTEADN